MPSAELAEQTANKVEKQIPVGLEGLHVMTKTERLATAQLKPRPFKRLHNQVFSGLRSRLR